MNYVRGDLLLLMNWNVSFAALGALGKRIASRATSVCAMKRAVRWAVSCAGVRMLTVLGLMVRLLRGLEASDGALASASRVEKAMGEARALVARRARKGVEERMLLEATRQKMGGMCC